MKRISIALLIIILAVASLLYLTALTPDRFGFYHDDGIYVITAKALATGQGYRIISLPDEPAQTKFPPFYPFLLSLIWRAFPHFPANLLPMMSLSLMATMVFLGLAFFYLVRRGYATNWQALLVTALVGVNWRIVILATGIYSEMVYAALSVGGLWLAETYEKPGRRWILGILLGGTLGLAFLTRTSGITLLVAVVAYYLLHQQYKKSSLPLLVAGSFILAWAGWCIAHRPTLEHVNAAFYTSYLADFFQLVPDLQTLLLIILKNAFKLIIFSIPTLILGLNYVQTGNFLAIRLFIITLTFIFIVEGLRRQMSQGLRLLPLYLFSYLSLHLFWPYTPYDRFIAPILPFLLFFLISEITYLISVTRNKLKLPGQITQKLGSVLLLLVLIGLTGITFYHHSSVLQWSLDSKTFYARRASEEMQTIGWINRHTAPSDVLLCYSDPLCYLNTGRKAIRPYLVKPSIQVQDEAAVYKKVKILFRIIKENNAHYLVSTSSDFEYESQSDLMRSQLKTLTGKYPETFVPVFRSANGHSVIYEINVGPTP